MAKERSRREHAGSKMARLLNNEDQDEFYSSVYGGFNEEQDDVDYQSESSGDDVVDSDFDAKEDDDVKSDDDDDAVQGKRKKRVVTKSYKEPKRQKTSASTTKPAKVEVKSEEPIKTKVTTRTERPAAPVVIEKKTLRRSTTVKSAAVGRREKERNARQQHLKDIAHRMNVPEVRRLTQEELLEEAKITEEINTRYLLQYQRLEIEKKKAKIQKQVARGPMIRYQSLTMPDIEDDPNVFGVTVDYETGQVNERPLLLKEGKCGRTFITFTEEATFRQVFTSPRPRLVRPRDRFCPITGRPARYMDPLTKTPYADSAAFRVLRHLYSIHVETGEKPISLLRKYRSGEIQVNDAC